MQLQKGLGGDMVDVVRPLDPGVVRVAWAERARAELVGPFLVGCELEAMAPLGVVLQPSPDGSSGAHALQHTHGWIDQRDALVRSRPWVQERLERALRDVQRMQL